ncbi:DTW domain-containing protein [Poseidonibacter lekithochrous]|uniref:tRNA-uridine aminocarboxypropyltransferase n=1 Tax=Poseidonibacter TaxID=2321187 RepID=UPI001C07F59B|nr:MULTISPECIES: tRNA-uridine aminocarboxypropyltransferase [Poseidonibacter]MBU3013655.1 DTW domain-containing protein [Poseidonibacter lekithochrous]MDO6826952.1 tRNA-uridine aminocarboxypropyltransferase [Poseidonibacter sp. 1_MG-2023]
MQDFKNREKCYKCYRPKSSCMCEHIIKPLKTNTKFVILMHPKEFKKTKNGTGHLTNNSIENCELHVGIDFTNNERINTLINSNEYEPFVLYPSKNSIKLNDEKIGSKKNALIFIIDSTWPCSKKMLRLSKNLASLKKVSFTHDKSSIFTIKTQPNEHCLSTIESTLCVLEQLNKHDIENIKNIYLEEFLNPFKKMVAFQISCTDEDKKYIRFKTNSSYK